MLDTTQRFLFGERGAFREQTRSLPSEHDGPSLPTVAEHVDENTGLSALVIMDSPDEKKQPRIEIKGDDGKMKPRYLLPSGSHLMAQDAQTVDAGDVLVKIPRETAKQKDTTGRLPRVVELFEARRPKEPAVITEVNGLVKSSEVTKSHRKVLVVTPDCEGHEYQLPRGAHVNVREGEAVPQGEASRWSRGSADGMVPSTRTTS